MSGAFGTATTSCQSVLRVSSCGFCATSQVLNFRYDELSGV